MCTGDHNEAVQQNLLAAQHLLSRMATARMGSIKPLSDTRSR